MTAKCFDCDCEMEKSHGIYKCPRCGYAVDVAIADSFADTTSVNELFTEKWFLENQGKSIVLSTANLSEDK